MNNPFSTYHPAVAFAFLACAIALSMAALQPVISAISLAGAFACACVTRGRRHALRMLGFVAVAAVIVTAANMVFSSNGETALFRLAGRAFTFESLVYGLCSGLMLASVLLWFSSFSACIGSDASMALFGRAAPTVALMVSQVMRLVPQFVSRGRDVMAVQAAVSAAAADTKRAVAADRLRAVSVLAGWGLEDGLVRGDAMRSRGYGCGVRRTTYRRYRIRRADAAVIAATLALAALSAAGEAAAMCGFSFYPVLAGLAPWWAYLPYVLFMAVPAGLVLRERLLWR